MTVSPHEATARLGLGRGLVYRLLKAGRLPAVKVGRRPHYRIPVRVLEEALAEPDRLNLSEEADKLTEEQKRPTVMLWTAGQRGGTKCEALGLAPHEVTSGPTMQGPAGSWRRRPNRGRGSPSRAPSLTA